MDRSLDGNTVIFRETVRAECLVQDNTKQGYLLPGHLDLPPVFSGIRVAESLVFLCRVLQIIVCPFFLFFCHCIILTTPLVSSYFSSYLTQIRKNTHHGRKSYSRLTKTIASQCQHLATYPLRVMTTVAYVLLTLLSVYFVLLDDFRNDNLHISLYTFFLFFGKIFCNYSV